MIAMRDRPIAKALHMTLTDEQVRMRDNLGNKSYWEERWREDSDGVCADLLALYTVTGEETRELISSQIDGKFDHFEQVFTSNYKKVVALVNEIEFKRKEDREQTDKNTADIETLKRAMDSIAYENMQIKGTVNVTLNDVSHIKTDTSEIKDDIRMLIQSSIDAGKIRTESTAKPVHSFWDKLPIQAWMAIAVGISGAIVYILTGEIINFGGG